MKTHVCSNGNHPEPSNACYVICRCRCYGCGFARSEYDRRRARQHAYGRPPMVDAEPVRQHVRSLMAPKKGSNRGMGWKRIARTSGVAPSTVWKLLYGDPARGMAPSKRVHRRTADALLAVRVDLADGATVPAGPTRRKLAAMVEGGFAKAELGRYLTGDVLTKSLQVGERRYVQVRHARQVDDLYRRWKNGEIIPRGRWSRHQYGPPPVTPATPGGERLRCVECDAPSLAGGRWCWPCFRTHSSGANPTGCGTDAGYTAHRRRSETPCQGCRDAHATAQQLRREVAA